MLEVIEPRKGNIRLLGIAIIPEEPFVLVNQTLQLSTRAKPSEAQKGQITWSGGSSSSITVNSTGLITGKSAEKRVSITANSDAVFSTWVYARCGYDVTDISMDDDELEIEGIQGVLFGVTVTPSGSTEISFAFRSSDKSVADYYWQDSSSYANQRRMWGYSVGNATVTAYGRSGNAQYPVNVTVTPVALQELEIRALPSVNGTVVTEQGDTIPNVAEYVYTMIGARGSIPIYFEPFNATQRQFSCEVDDESIAEVETFDGTTTYYNRVYGVARYETVAVHAKSAGTTNLTVTPRHGEGTSVEIRVITQSQMSGNASHASSPSIGYGCFILSGSYANASINNVEFVSTTDPNRDNSTYYRNGTTVTLNKADGSKSARWAGYWTITMDDGSSVSISNSVSHSA